VVRSRPLTPTTHGIELEKPADFAFQPTQFTFLQLETPTGLDVRPMSLATSTTRPHLEYGVRLSESAFKPTFALQPGDTVVESVLTATVLRVKCLSDEIAVVHARMTLTGQSPVEEISTPRQRSNVMSFVVHRTTEGWRCGSAHNTDVVPGAETNVVDDQGRLRSVSYRDRH